MRLRISYLNKVFFILAVSGTCFLPSASGQLAVDGSVWLYKNEGSLNDHAYIKLETLGDTLADFLFERPLLRKLRYSYLDDQMVVQHSKHLLIWNDSLNGGHIISFFIDSVNSPDLDRHDETFLYTYKNVQEQQWHSPVNKAFNGRLYHKYDIISEDTIHFNDSISSFMYSFEPTPNENYLCETVIARIGSMGFMLPMNKDKNNYRAGRLLWYFDPKIDTFWVPDTFGCDVRYTSVDKGHKRVPGLQAHYKGNGSLVYKVHIAGGQLTVYQIDGKTLLSEQVVENHGTLQIPTTTNGLVLVQYTNIQGHKETLKLPIGP